MDEKQKINLKPVKTYEEQLEILKSRGLIVKDDAKALNTLKRINYYRFSAYTLSFKENDQFYSGVTFDHIFRHYEFDSKLRYLLLELIEYVEISFRTHIAYLIGHKYGPLGYRDATNFRNERYHNIFLHDLDRLLQKSRDPFVLWHQKKYRGHYPVWVAFETLMFSTLSKLYINLLIEDQRKIAKEYYGLHFNEVSSWLYALTIIRNRCAHYSRLFNHVLPIKPRFRHIDQKLELPDNLLFGMIYNLKYLIKDCNIWVNWQFSAIMSSMKETPKTHSFKGFRSSFFRVNPAQVWSSFHRFFGVHGGVSSSRHRPLCEDTTPQVCTRT